MTSPEPYIAGLNLNHLYLVDFLCWLAQGIGFITMFFTCVLVFVYGVMMLVDGLRKYDITIQGNDQDG